MNPGVGTVDVPEGRKLENTTGTSRGARNGIAKMAGEIEARQEPHAEAEATVAAEGGERLDQGNAVEIHPDAGGTDPRRDQAADVQPPFSSPPTLRGVLLKR